MPRDEIHLKRKRITGAILALLGLLIPLAALEPDDAKHLLLRTGFVATPAELARLLPLTRAQAVDALIASTRTVARTTPGFLNPDPRTNRPMMVASPERALKAWWYQEMVTTDSPLTERMVLFWHNHFTSAFSKVLDVRLLYDQNVLLRRSALGNFALLLRDIDLDAAMFLYLDKDSNRANSPNENYAREVMELFTLGEGQQYTEDDIKEAARAFTGYHLDNRKRVVPRGDHDPRPKLVLGHAVESGQDVILQLLLKEERVATYIAGKFWREFISEQPDEVVVRTLAADFYRAKYDIRVLLRATLLSEAFWHPAQRGQLVKSPVEFLVGLARTLQAPVGEGELLVEAGRNLGQDLFEPPNVKGWRGANAWLNCETMLQRWRVVDTLVDAALRPRENAGKPAEKKAKAKLGKTTDGCPLVPVPWLDEARSQGAAGVAQTITLLLPLPPAEPIADHDFSLALRAILHDATFHLK